MSKETYIKPIVGEFGFCETCGGQRSTPDAKLCNGCWSIEAHLESYLRDGRDKAIYFVSSVLEAAKREEVRRKLIEEVETQRISDEDMNMDNDTPERYNEAITDAIAVMRDLDLIP